MRPVSCATRLMKRRPVSCCNPLQVPDRSPTTLYPIFWASAVMMSRRGRCRQSWYARSAWISDERSVRARMEHSSPDDPPVSFTSSTQNVPQEIIPCSAYPICTEILSSTSGYQSPRNKPLELDSLISSSPAWPSRWSRYEMDISIGAKSAVTSLPW